MITSRPERVCLLPGCGAIGDWVGGYCPTHTRSTETGRKRTKLNIYNVNWERLKASLRGCGNTICQRVGPCPGEPSHCVRCSQPVYLYHHIIDAESRPELAYNQLNVVGVCKSCHPQPGNKDQGRFVPTLWRTPMSNEPMPEMVCLPGEKVPEGVVLWTLANRMALLR